MIRQGLISVILAMALTTAAVAGDRISLPLFGVSIVLPDGWTGTVPPAKPIPTKDQDHAFQTQIETSCTTAACAVSQDVCEIKTYDDIIGLWDLVSNRMLFPDQASMVETTRTVLEWTSKGASVTKPLGREILGPNTWFTIETKAAPGYKGVLHGRTVLQGRYLWALCRTCATNDTRFDSARNLLSSIAVDKGKA